MLGCLWWYEGGSGHEGLGYAALALALWRVALGWRSRSPQVRFAGFVRAPAATWAYARAVTACREPRHLGHNPLGGWMIVALLATAVVAGASGALYATDRFWGDAVVHAVHSVAGWALALLLPLHLGGVALSSWRHRENLVAAMLGGHKRPPAPGDVDLG